MLGNRRGSRRHAYDLPNATLGATLPGFCSRSDRNFGMDHDVLQGGICLASP